MKANFGDKVIKMTEKILIVDDEEYVRQLIKKPSHHIASQRR